MKAYVRLCFLVLLAVIIASAQQCPMRKTDCVCDFSGEAPDGYEEEAAATQNKSEILAAAAGAISPLLLGGAGLGLYKLLRKGGGDSGSPGIQRSVSDMSEVSTSRSDPPGYDSRRGSFHKESAPSFQNRGFQPPRAAPKHDPNAWMGDF